MLTITKKVKKEKYPDVMVIKDLKIYLLGNIPSLVSAIHSQELSRHIGIISNPRQLYSFLFFFSLTLPTPIHYMYVLVHGVLAVRSSRPWDKGLGPGVKKFFFRSQFGLKIKGEASPGSATVMYCIASTFQYCTNLKH